MAVCAACGGANPEGMRFCGHCAAPLDSTAPGRDDALRKMVSRQVAERLAAGGELSDEWRLVTTLFADISGYVALGERLDPESYAEATGPIVALMTRVAERYDAHVAKFAGDALLCMFGAPVAREDDADRALLAALEMRAELDALRPSLPEVARDLELHIGVNTGRVVAAILGDAARLDYNVMGDAVNSAQRLESAAPGGEIYAGDATVRLVRDRFEFERVGELTVKGKREPIGAWRLIGRRRTAAPRASAPLVARDAEVAALAGVFSRLLGGRGAVVCVTGEAGVGKSRLCADAASRVRPRGVRSLVARFPSAGSVAYGPYRDLVRSVAGIESGDPAARAARALQRTCAALGLEAAEPYLARVAGLPGDTAVRDPEAVRRGVHEAFVALIDALVATSPLALTIEDFHWADESSAALTEEIAAMTAARPLALLLTARPEARAMLDAIAMRGEASSRLPIALDPLDDAGVAMLVDNTLGGSAPAGLATVLRERAAGNPFFVEEIVRSLVEAGTLRRAAGGWTVDGGWDAGGVPPTIEGVLAARLDRLPPEAVAVAQVAAVAGRRVRLRLLHDVLGGANLDVAVAALVASGLVDRDGDDAEPSIAFHHALAAEVAYERLLRRRRTELHRMIADAAERLYGDGDDVVELLARHRYLGGGGEAAFELLVRAGERARRLYANGAALTHFERALEVAPDARRPEIALAIADLCELRGDYARALAVYEEVRDATGDVRAWRGIASTMRKRGDYDLAIEMLDAALVAGAADPAALRLEHGWTLSVAGRYREAIASLRTGLSAAPARRDEVTAALLLELARAETVERDLVVALTHGEAARAIFAERGDERGLASSIRIVAAALHRLGRLDEAAAALGDGLTLAERTGDVEERAACLINLGMVELERERIDDAIECDRRAIAEFERIGHASGRAIGYGNLAEKLLRAGDLGEAERWCERALEHARGIGHTPTIADATRTRALIALQRGDHAEARAAAEEAARVYEQMGVPAEAAEARRIGAG
ncbi:MAG TPA: adenylate/guanylate cyclase domain-containing protein [Actinomycetota bacterium]|nr:adenylate/guanylate cyclase domain-containing protein [Actinomycetota bacterium]